tara:strand:+ start:208 stop:723 length:516 start_codon:yes stop_codon:yes gene_type:complete
MDKICGLDERFSMLNDRLTLIEETVGINNFMANDGNVGNVGSGNVGVGSTVPPDVARYQELVAAKSAGNVGAGSTAPAGNVGGTASGDYTSDGNVGNVGTGSTAPAANVGPGPVPDWDGNGNIDDWARDNEPVWDGVSVANEEQASALYKARAAREAATGTCSGNVGVGSA